MRKRQQYYIATFCCIKCKNSITLPRFKNSKREKFHLKDIYCISCHTITHHLELPFDQSYIYNDFLEDHNNGVFKESE